MGHEKVYAICENMCMEETLTKEGITNKIVRVETPVAYQGAFYYDILDRQPVLGEVFRILLDHPDMASETGELMLSMAYPDNTTATYPLKGINGNQANSIGRPVEVWFAGNCYKLVDFKSSICVGAKADPQDITISTAWGANYISLETINNQTGNKLTLDTYTKSIYVGEGVKKVRISAHCLARGVTGYISSQIIIMRNNTRVNAFNGLYSKSNDVNLWRGSATGIIETEVQEGDEIRLSITSDVTGTIKVSTASAVYMTVEEID